MEKAADYIHFCQIAQKLEGPWFIQKDMNCDGVFTISDVGLWAEWLFFLPGDGLLWALMQWQDASVFLELTSEYYSGWFSGIFSGLVWFTALTAWGVISAEYED